MAKLVLVKLTVSAKNLDAMPEIRTDYKGESIVIGAHGSLEIGVDAEMSINNCDVSLADISEKIAQALRTIEI